MAALPQEVIEKVYDIVRNPPADNKYNGLKDILIKRLSMSEEKRISPILYHQEIGDRSPSDFHRHLTQLAGSDESLKTLVNKIWADRLPTPVDTTVISLMGQGVSQEIYLQTADRVWEKSSSRSRISAIQNPLPICHATVCHSPPPQNDQGNKRLLTEIESIVAKYTSKRQKSSNFNSTNKKSNSPPPNKSNSDRVCWYHKKYGHNAKKCQAPCSKSAKKN